MSKTVFEIDGLNFGSLDEFFQEVSRILIPGAEWGHNLDAFNDILRGGFGTPNEGFVIRWKNSSVSRERLGYPETIRQLENRLLGCHPLNREHVRGDLNDAFNNLGPTVYDWLIEIIREHCRGGREEDDGIDLVLE